MRESRRPALAVLHAKLVSILLLSHPFELLAPLGAMAADEVMVCIEKE